ncbi:MAG: CoA-transferase [Methanomassiliicoccales archaeon]|jgi:glutaconate CoA-transferase subunit B
MIERFEVGIDELFVVNVARTIKDRTTVFHGVSSPIPMVAMYLAKLTHAKDMVYFGGVSSAVDPNPPFMPPTTNDWVMIQGRTAMVTVDKIFDLAQRGELDRSFFSGAQIDKYGNQNVSMIGTPDKCKIKFPGGAGGCNLSCDCVNYTIWTTRHRAQGKGDKKFFTLVNKCDFVTNVGHVTPYGRREELDLVGNGPDWVVTELGVFDFDEKARSMRLRYLYPDTTVKDVLDNTEFEPVIHQDVRVMDMPAREEVEIIRRIDPLGVRKFEYPKRELTRRFKI